MSSPNLFNALFEFFPREGHSPKENYLSEAFAYFLRTSDCARDGWLSLALGRPVQAIQAEITTRASEDGGDGVTVFPDMLIVGRLSTGEEFRLYSEHKWDSPVHGGQLAQYLKISQSYGPNSHLVFVGSTLKQKRDAARGGMLAKDRCFAWADIYTMLQKQPGQTDALVEFLDFMKTHGLSPGSALKVSTMVAFLESVDFLGNLERMAHKLNTDYLDFLPDRYRSNPVVKDRWGRVAIEFATPAWKPTITAGFLYSERDHKVKFTQEGKGIDLMLRLEASPQAQKQVAGVLSNLRQRSTKLGLQADSVLVSGDRRTGNPNTLLIVRSCLGQLTENFNREEEQLEVLHGKFRTWAEILFLDGTLEAALRDAGLDSQPRVP